MLAVKAKAETAYSPIRHLAWALWLNHNPARCYLTVATTFAGFFDASGKPQDPVLYVSGFLSTEKKWLRFEKEWRALLNHFEIKGLFHTADYVRGVGDDYRQFLHNDERRIEFERKAIAIIKRNTLKPFSYGIILADHREMVARYELPYGFERPYSFCGLQGVYWIVLWMKKKKGLSLEDKVHPFSAADILAWRHARLIREHEAQAPRPRREFFGGLFKQLPHDSCGFYNRRVLISFCEEKSFPRRPQPSDASGASDV